MQKTFPKKIFKNIELIKLLERLEKTIPFDPEIVMDDEYMPDPLLHIENDAKYIYFHFGKACQKGMRSSHLLMELNRIDENLTPVLTHDTVFLRVSHDPPYTFLIFYSE